MFPTTPRYTQSGGAEGDFTQPDTSATRRCVRVSSSPRPSAWRRVRRPRSKHSPLRSASQRAVVAVATVVAVVAACTLTVASWHLNIASHPRLRYGSTPHLHRARRVQRRVLSAGLAREGICWRNWVYLLFPALMNRPKPPPPSTPSTAATTTLHQFSAQMTLVFFVFLFFRYRPSPRRGGTERYGHADAATRNLEVNGRRVTIQSSGAPKSCPLSCRE